MSTTNILDLNNRIDELEKNSGGGGSADSAKRSDIASEFSATTAYTAGCFVYYEGKLYQFNADHAAGAWDPTDVVEANVTDQVVSNASAIAGLTASDVAYDNTTSGLTATDIQGAVDELADSYPAAKVMLSDGVTSVQDALLRIKKANISGTTSANGNIIVGYVTNITIISAHINGDSDASYNAIGQYATDRTYLHVYNDSGDNASSKAISGYYYYVEES